LSKSGVKIGFSVNNKIGKAVVRNKVKRRMRAIMQKYVDRIKPCQAVFIASVGVDQLSYASLCKQIHKCLVKAELLDEKEEESDEQKEEEWISYPCQPSNESNSLSLTLFDCPPCLQKEVECYVPVDSLEIFPMSKTRENNYATVIYDNPCYFDKSYDNALFVPDIEMHGTKEFCLANVYDKALDDGPM
jgi:RNase P protein component